MPRNSTGSVVSYENRRRKIIAWPAYTIDQYGRVFRVNDPIEIFNDRKGDYVMLGVITPGQRITNDKTKRYISDLMRHTWPEVKQLVEDETVFEHWKGIPGYPTYEISKNGTVRHVTTLHEVKVRYKPGHYAGTIGIFKTGERQPHTLSVDKIYRALFGKPYPRKEPSNV